MQDKITLDKVVSGGQTGVDRAALDAALEFGFPIGGWCPRGRLAEDGRIPQYYPLKETPSVAYSQRTEWNVRDSDATLILYRKHLYGGTALTRDLARLQKKACLALDVSNLSASQAILEWIVEQKVEVLNCAGPRESGCPGIYWVALDVMRKLLAPTIEARRDGESWIEFFRSS